MKLIVTSRSKVISIYSDLSINFSNIVHQQHLGILALKNDEMKEILDPTNEADFKQDIAEKDLGYGKGDEKVYVSPDSGK